MTDNQLLRFLVVIGDYVVTYLVIALFMRFTPFADIWSDGQTRVFLLSVFFGLLVAQLRFSSVVHRHFVSVDSVLRNTTWFVLTFGVCTYLLMRFIGVVGEDTGYWLLWMSLAAWVGVLLVRGTALYAWPLVQRRHVSRSGILFVGNGLEESGLCQWLRRSPSYSWRKMYYYSDARVEALAESLSYLGTLSDFHRLVRDDAPLEAGIGEVFCLMPRTQQRQMERVAEWCDRHVLRFFYVPERAEQWGLSLSPVLLDDHEIYTRFESPLSGFGNRCVKRTFDIVFSIVALIPITLSLPWFAWRIRRESPGPLFFAQERTGYGGKTFRCLKFRSMHVNTQSDTLQATADDPRKFPFGDFMRRTNLDELPQFFNVLRGEMSVVGPRPHMLHHTDIYGTKIRQYMARHFVRPGITGWAQVTGWRGETQTDAEMEGRVRSDIWYMEHWSIWLDMRIILKTVKTIFVHDEKAY